MVMLTSDPRTGVQRRRSSAATLPYGLIKLNNHNSNNNKVMKTLPAELPLLQSFVESAAELDDYK